MQEQIQLTAEELKQVFTTTMVEMLNAWSDITDALRRCDDGNQKDALIECTKRTLGLMRSELAMDHGC